MSTTKIAVLGSGISGAVCASILARNGVSVTLFESARGPGGRMSQRREITEDGKELLFDHGTPFFTATNSEVLSLVHDWESKGLVAEWKENFGGFDCISRKFIDIDQKEACKRYVGVPGMNSICRALCSETGVETKFGTGVGKVDWQEEENLWLLMGFHGQCLGHFYGIVTSDKNIFSSRFTVASGNPPPLNLSLALELTEDLQHIPVHPCFALMLAFASPQSSIAFKGLMIKNSEVLSWAYCDNSKPGRPTTSEQWVIHSTAQYAQSIIARTGLQKLSDETLAIISDELFQELRRIGLITSEPIFKKAHRWGSAFPAKSVAREKKCLLDRKKRLAICGDFCTSPDVEGAIVSGMSAASKLMEILSCL